jgi:signal transduction histidine kinase
MQAGELTRAALVAHAQRGHRGLALRPLLAVSAMLALAMLVLGFWGSDRLEAETVQRAAAESAFEVDQIVHLPIQDLAREPGLSPDNEAALAAMFGPGTLAGQTVPLIKVWSRDGMVAFSNRRDLIGQRQPVNERIRRAFAGVIAADLADPVGDLSACRGLAGQGLLRIAAPLRETGTDRVIAVAEYSEWHSGLRLALWNLRLQIWALTVAATLAVVALLFVAALRRERRSLLGREAVLTELLDRNNELHADLRSAYRRLRDNNEILMRRVSAELHDVPAQLIGFALLRLDALRATSAGPGGNGAANQDRAGQGDAAEPRTYETIRTALAESLDEIRKISAGLAAPEVSTLSLSDLLRAAANRHAERTGALVDIDIAELPDIVVPALKTCVYRFVQEGLNNAYKHAGGRGQLVHAHQDGSMLEIRVSDQGPGFPPDAQVIGSAGRLGLAGLRTRIESLGGALEIRSRPGHGTDLLARFNLNEVDPEYV